MMLRPRIHVGGTAHEHSTGESVGDASPVTEKSEVIHTLETTDGHH